MAFESKKLELLAGGGAGLSLWGYITNDTAASVDTAGYFNQAADMLRVGDRIAINAAMATAPTYGNAVVVQNAGGVVDLADITPLTATDTR